MLKETPQPSPSPVPADTASVPHHTRQEDAEYIGIEILKDTVEPPALPPEQPGEKPSLFVRIRRIFSGK